MRRIKLGTVPGSREPMPIAPFLLDALNRTPVEGRNPITIAEMRRRLKIIDRIEAAQDAPSVDIEDAEYEVLKAIMATVGLGEVSRAVVAIEDQILAAERVNPV